jgi:hypothetical protein
MGAADATGFRAGCRRAHKASDQPIAAGRTDPWLPGAPCGARDRGCGGARAGLFPHQLVRQAARRAQLARWCRAPSRPRSYSLWSASPVWITIDGGHRGDALCVAALLIGQSGYWLPVDCSADPEARVPRAGISPVRRRHRVAAGHAGARSPRQRLLAAARRLRGPYRREWPWDVHGTFPQRCAGRSTASSGSASREPWPAPGFLQLSVILAPARRHQRRAEARACSVAARHSSVVPRLAAG